MKLSGDRNQCPTCSEYFNSTYAFDRHRDGSFGVYNTQTKEWDDGDRRCLSVPEMSKIGMSKNQNGFWVSEVNPKHAL